MIIITVTCNNMLIKAVGFVLLFVLLHDMLLAKRNDTIIYIKIMHAYLRCNVVTVTIHDWTEYLLYIVSYES